MQQRLLLPSQGPLPDTAQDQRGSYTSTSEGLLVFCNASGRWMPSLLVMCRRCEEHPVCLFGDPAEMHVIIWRKEDDGCPVFMGCRGALRRKEFEMIGLI